MAQLGVRRISLGSALTRAAFTLLDRALAQLREGRLEFLDGAWSNAYLNRLFADERGTGAADALSE